MRKVFSTPGRLLALAVLIAAVLVRICNPQFLATIRLRGFDLEQRLAPRSYQPTPLRIVAIDERSVERYGQWPWPRTVVARLVDRIAAGHPLVLGVDIIFAEPDRFSPATIAETLSLPQSIAHEMASLPGGDAALAAAFRKVPTVLGSGVLVKAASGLGTPNAPQLHRFSSDPSPFLISYPRRLRSLPLLSAAAVGEGALLAEPDADGILRRMPLMVRAEGKLLPSISLEMLRVAFKTSVGAVTASDGVHGATLGGFFIPSDRRGRAYPYFTQFPAYSFVSAAKLLDGSYDPAGLSGCLVFLGVTAMGLTDQKQTPLGPMYGLETQAQMADSILTRKLLRRPASLNLIELAAAVAVGLFTIFLLPYRRPSVAGIMFVVLIISILGISVTSFLLSRLLFDAAFPVFAAIAIYGVMLTASLRAAETERRRLAADLASEREVKAHLEGELGAARAIQMGLLPRRFPERRDVDIHACIEPARMVGGDLYDFVLLSPELLSFAIADVSGEGVPAALFMAMSKEVLRAAAMRYGLAQDRAVEEANAKIAAANSEMARDGANMMFVTVFAALLNLASGELLYVNAGHPPPLVTRPEAEIAVLDGAGGPPLGTVEDFTYPLERHQMAPGEMLVLYTDGVTEAENTGHSFYGLPRLRSLLAPTSTTSAQAVTGSILADVRQFTGEAQQADDITVLALRWLGGA